MDFTPKSEQETQDSGISSSFESSRHFFESTPKNTSDTTSANAYSKRKRKASNFKTVKLTDESYPSTPQFSSTLNESLTSHFENCHIERDYYDSDDIDRPNKFFKDCRSQPSVRSLPTTPEKQVKTSDSLRTPSSSFIKSFSLVNVQSPLKAQHEILYATLKPLERTKKPLTPQKFKEKLDKTYPPAKKCLFVSPRRDLFNDIVTNVVIMGNIFKYLSSGDLYRLSMVSMSLRDALGSDKKANGRFLGYKQMHKTNKENYRITPPGSPAREDWMTGSASPNSRNFRSFVDIVSTLNENQTLTKCLRCSKPSIIEKNIAQCQEIQSCGVIFCTKCHSCANKPEEFIDNCDGAYLNTTSQKTRRQLEDLSNSGYGFYKNVSASFYSSSFNISSFNNAVDSSGFYSGCDVTSSPVMVRRNLSKSFASQNDSIGKPKVLFEHNRNQTNRERVQRRTSLVPVVQAAGRRKIEVMEPSSPPKIKANSACSRQSKKNLKRLTR